MERILGTDPGFSPERTRNGHWNFFEEWTVLGDERSIAIAWDQNVHFEWKDMRNTEKAQYHLLCNDLLGILQDAMGHIWSDDWELAGKSAPGRYTRNSGMLFQVEYILERTGEITTPAGTFPDCMKLAVNIGDQGAGLSYRCGRKEYIFAGGVGVVRAVHYKNEEEKAIYELTDYEGTGEGYMPMESGMMRHYDAVNIPEGYTAFTEYMCQENDAGVPVLLANRCGLGPRRDGVA